MTRPIDLLNTALLAAIAALLAIQLLTPAPSQRAEVTEAPEIPSIPCRVAELFGGGEEHSCIPVRVLEAP